MPNYSIKVIAVAIGKAREKSRYTYLTNFGQKIDIGYNVFLIEGNGRKILVDTGGSAKQREMLLKSRESNEFFNWDQHPLDVEDVTPLEEGLAHWQLAPEDIDTVILTHLHWDHVMNVTKLPNARVIVQKAEWEAALSPHPLHKFYYASRDFYENLRNVELVNGDIELFPGIRLLLTPGHTPGGQSVIVQTEKGKYAISGFCTILENFYPPKKLQTQIGHSVIPAGIHLDAAAAYESILKLLQLSDVVLPVHEITLAQKAHIVG